MKEIGQVGKFVIALIVLIPFLAFLIEIAKPGYVFSLLAGAWIWLFLIVAAIVAIVIVKNKLEGSSV